MKEVIVYIELIFIIVYGYVCLWKIEIVEGIIEKILIWGRQKFKKKIYT
ncbi:MAG: hypothetical protein AB1567_11350 [bacterium]